MTAGYRYIDHTADIALEVSGNTYAELFTAALDGWKNTVIESSEGHKKTEEKKIELEELSAEELLVSFLQELNYLFESKKIFPVGIYNLRILENDKSFSLRSVIRFSGVSGADKIKAEIKAVTFHRLDIKKVNNVYKTLIVFDI